MGLRLKRRYQIKSLERNECKLCDLISEPSLPSGEEMANSKRE